MNERYLEMREDWDDIYLPDMECLECGMEWWGNWTRGRVDPPEPRNSTCPRCGA
jgi:hypothetical protein